MKTLYIKDGNVYIEPGTRFNVDIRTYADKDNLFIQNYNGVVVLDDKRYVRVTGNANISGILRNPAYIETNGKIDLIVSPMLTLGAHSKNLGSTINGLQHMRSSFGVTLYEVAQAYYRKMYGDSTPYISEDADNQTISFVDRNLNRTVDLAKIIHDQNAAFIFSNMHPCHIRIEHDTRSIPVAGLYELDDARRQFSMQQRYEDAALFKSAFDKKFKEALECVEDTGMSMDATFKNLRS